MAANKFVASLMTEYILKRGKAPDGHLISALRKGIDSEWRRIYNEQRCYQAAYLLTLRKHLLPKVRSYPDPEAEEAIMKSVYECPLPREVNELSIEEHKLVAKGELLEQLYYQFAGLHRVARNVEIVFPKETYKQSTRTDLLDPNAFVMSAR